MARPLRGQEQHEVSVYYDNSAELVVNEPKQEVVWSRPKVEGLSVVRIGSKDQPVLQKAGDDLRIDWGNLYVAAPNERRRSMCIAGHEKARRAFARTAVCPKTDDTRMPRAANDDWPVTACVFDLGEVGDEADTAISDAHLRRRILDRVSWHETASLLATQRHGCGETAANCRRAIRRIGARCDAFDCRFMADWSASAARITPNSAPWPIARPSAPTSSSPRPTAGRCSFSKECFSNGCIGTVDVIYPAAPIFMLLNNDLLKASVTPVFDYAATPRWKFPFAPHDLGTYPKANGQVYGGGERTEENQMPVEESGNMLVIAAVISQLDGNTKYAERYWPQLERWAAFLKEKGLDPANQLCTDDFAGQTDRHCAWPARRRLTLIGFAVHSAVSVSWCRADSSQRRINLAFESWDAVTSKPL